MNSYIMLMFSVLCEVFGTTMLKLSDGFTKLFPSVGVVIGFAFAFYGLSLSLKTISLSLAYAIWSGAGTAFTVLIGVFFWNDPFTVYTFVGLVFIIGGIVLLNTPFSSSKRRIHRHLYEGEN